MSKKEFAWDKETLVKTIEVSAYEKREIRVCELKGKEYVSFTTLKKIKNEWKPTGGYTIPKEFFGDIYDAVNDYDFNSSFGTDPRTALKGIKPAPAAEPKKTNKKTDTKAEPKKSTKTTASKKGAK